jgi:protein gp37
MGLWTPIQYCHSSINLMMGCDGCELWDLRRGVRHCYAGGMTERLAGQEGFPAAFDRPALFTHRLGQALRWPDLTGWPCPDKPWLDGYPRIVFLNDMGDTFTESLPPDWLSPLVPRLAASPHVWLLLTKRPARMLAWVRRYREQAPFPRNFWLCASVTGTGTLGRVVPVLDLARELPRHVVGLSVEPLLADVVPELARQSPTCPPGCPG